MPSGIPVRYKKIHRFLAGGHELLQEFSESSRIAVSDKLRQQIIVPIILLILNRVRYGLLYRNTSGFAKRHHMGIGRPYGYDTLYATPYFMAYDCCGLASPDKRARKYPQIQSLEKSSFSQRTFPSYLCQDLIFISRDSAWGIAYCFPVPGDDDHLPHIGGSKELDTKFVRFFE